MPSSERVKREPARALGTDPESLERLAAAIFGLDDPRTRFAAGFRGLTDREQLILWLRYGLGGEEEHTLEQIGQSLGLSRERVRQLEARALRKLRDTLPAQRLYPIVEPVPSSKRVKREPTRALGTDPESLERLAAAIFGLDDPRTRFAAGFRGLTDREQLILRLRYGLGGEEEHTLEQIGQSLGLSRERVRQLEARALRKLREGPDQQRLYPILEP